MQTSCLNLPGWHMLDICFSARSWLLSFFTLFLPSTNEQKKGRKTNLPRIRNKPIEQKQTPCQVKLALGFHAPKVKVSASRSHEVRRDETGTALPTSSWTVFFAWVCTGLLKRNSFSNHLKHGPLFQHQNNGTPPLTSCNVQVYNVRIPVVERVSCGKYNVETISGKSPQEVCKYCRYTKHTAPLKPWSITSNSSVSFFPLQ